MKTKLDRYSLLIISKYFDTHNDYINAMLTNKKFDGLVDMFHFNPIPIDDNSKRLFINIETQHIYDKCDEIIPNLFNYIVWYPSSIKSIEYFEKRYHIRPIFKKLYVNNTFIDSGKKVDGDLLYLSGVVTDDFSETLDCSQYVGFGDYSLYYSPVEKIVLGRHIHSIPFNCCDCCSLRSIDLSNITEVNCTFSWSTNLTAITLSKHIEIMDINCFCNCSALQSITISDNSKEFELDLSYELFKIMKSNGIKCTGNVWVTNDETPIDTDQNIRKLKEFCQQEVVKIDSIRVIPSYFCDSLNNEVIRQIILSPNVVGFKNQAFCNLKSLESINLEHVKQINFGSFMNCKNLRQANISNTRYLGENAFHGCSFLTSVTYSKYLNNIPQYSFADCLNLKEIKGIELVSDINSKCFRGCRKLKFNELPKHVYKIGFGNGSRFKIKSIDSECTIIHFQDGCFKGNNTIETIHIRKNGIFKKTLGIKVFSFCTSLKELKLEGINYLDRCCFKDCYSLSTIELSSSLKAIGKYCFENCRSLKEIQIPSTVKYIGKGAFLSCKSLTKVVFANGKSKMGSYVFKHCPLKEIKLINGNKMKGCFSYDHYSLLKSNGIDVKKVEYTRSDRRKYGNIIPECCCSIGDRTFEGCSMKELTIPSNIKTLQLKCFNKCENLNKIYMSSELKNKIKGGVNKNYNDLALNEFPFVVFLSFTEDRFFSRLLYEKSQKDELIPIEIIEI